MRGRTPFLLSVVSVLLLGASQIWLVRSVAEPTIGASSHHSPVADAHGAPSLVGSLFDPVVSAMPAALDHPDIPLDYQNLWSETLKSLPLDCQSSLRDVFVQFDRPSQRGFSGKSSIILYAGFDLSRLDQRDEARALFVHEFGHITDLGCYAGTSQTPSGFTDGSEVIPVDDPSVGFYQISWQNSTMRNVGSLGEDFVSGYAASDPFEDFAETYAYYALQEPAFAARAQTNAALAKKYAWMQKYAFASGAPNALGLSQWNGAVPWDTTLLPYAWTGGLVASAL